MKPLPSLLQLAISFTKKGGGHSSLSVSLQGINSYEQLQIPNEAGGVF